MLYNNIRELLTEDNVDFNDTLRIKLFKKYIKTKETENLFLLYTPSVIKNEEQIHTECNGLIFDKKTLKLVCGNQYNFVKRLPIKDEIDSIEYCEDGTIIRMYYYNDKWNISTNKCIDANNSFWSSDKSFKEMFLEIFEDSYYNKMNTSKSYIFVLKHTNNMNIIKHYENSIVYLLNIDNNTEDIDYINPFKDVISPLKTDQELIRLFNENPDLISSFDFNSLFKNDKRGLILKLRNNNMIKIDFEQFSILTEIRGNTPLIRIRYLELLNDPSKLNILIKYYSQEYKMLFTMIQYSISNIINNIHKLYIDTHVTHKYTIDETHPYITTNNPIKLEDVYYKFINLNTVEKSRLLDWIV